MNWNLYRGTVPEQLGLIPHFFDDLDPRPAEEQLAARYQYLGDPFTGFTPTASWDAICYPGDPPLPLLADTYLREERILFFEYAWVVIVQPDGAFKIWRCD